MLLARAAARAGAAVPRPRGCPARRPAPPAAATNDGPAHDVSLSRGARQSETSAVNLRAVAGRDAIDAAAGNLAKTLRGASVLGLSGIGCGVGSQKGVCALGSGHHPTTLPRVQPPTLAPVRRPSHHHRYPAPLTLHWRRHPGGRQVGG